MKADAETWVRETETSIERGEDRKAGKPSQNAKFATLIDRHIDDLAKYRKHLRRSKEAALLRLKRELGGETLARLTRRERLIEFGCKRQEKTERPRPQ